ncbi:hypothetical protein NDU88_002545 [Pleurodeles waltl]|uniref:Uncharacterized protein n=1 Tax=Pleurodeles waltl TaxID=8319 RepID=A0AAV7QA83_PLEWA|nr:hypothetical protein NDU88_002545 [Pleurodeles waltl]
MAGPRVAAEWTGWACWESGHQRRGERSCWARALLEAELAWTLWPRGPSIPLWVCLSPTVAGSLAPSFGTAVGEGRRRALRRSKLRPLQALGDHEGSPPMSPGRGCGPCERGARLEIPWLAWREAAIFRWTQLVPASRGGFAHDLHRGCLSGGSQNTADPH